MCSVNFKHSNNSLFQHKCIDYSIIGYIYLKNLKNPNMKLQIKRHLINENDENYSPYHFYIEVKLNNKEKYIIDNQNLYSFWNYKHKFRPKHIRKIKVKYIKKAYYQHIKNKNNLEYFIKNVEINIQHYYERIIEKNVDKN